MSAIDPITLSVLWNGLIAVADDMGVTLRRTAYSAAVREGDDFSTGLFDAEGRLARCLTSGRMRSPTIRARC